MQPSYIGCYVCPEWLCFSNFKKWYDEHYKHGYQLDKDLIVVNNKEYSPATCIMIPQWLNKFTTDNRALRGEFPIGVCFNKRIGKFKASCSNPFTRKIEHLGYFDDPICAHLEWKNKKLEHVEAMKKLLDDLDNRLYDAIKTKIHNVQ